jgi:dienelactone hydrolase
LGDNLADPKWFTPEATPQMKQALGKLFGPGGDASADVMVSKLYKCVDELKAEGKIKRYAALGYCWGAKVITIEQTDAALWLMKSRLFH